MAKLIIPILSDIHFEAANPIASRASQIASAICSVDTTASHFLIILSGDIAWSGSTQDYEIASNFLKALKSRILDRRPNADIEIVSTPGNHDCVLPPAAAANRKSKVEAAGRIIADTTPDEYFIQDVLAAQDDYWKFSRAHTLSDAVSGLDKLCEVFLYERPGICIQLNLLNSATLSQHNEVKGGLLIAAEYAKSKLNVDPRAQVVISATHHWNGWLDPNNMIAVRQTLSTRSDIIVTGHQHVSFLSSQKIESGEVVLFFESPALYDKQHPTTSNFRTLTVETSNALIAEHSFRWKEGIYRATPAVGDTKWAHIPCNRAFREPFNISLEYLKLLSDPGVAYIHSAEEDITLSQLFVYPDLKIKEKRRNDPSEIVRGTRVLSTISEAALMLVQGGPLCGKTALSKALFLDLSAQKGKVVIRLDGKKIEDMTVEGFEREIARAFSAEYSNPDRDRFFQLEPQRRAVIIDDWHLARLSEVQRLAIYRFLEKFAQPSVLFVDDLFQIRTIAGGKQAQTTEIVDVKLTEASISGLSNVSRGTLIANWLRLRSSSRLEPPEISREAKDTEDLISHRLNKDSLPPFAFFVLCMLQAEENKTTERTAGGSFGHLYEVLVTTALNKGSLPDNLLDKKFALLDEIAIELWRTKAPVVSRSRIEEIAEDFRASRYIALPVDRLLLELVEARVLAQSEDHYRFAYEHFFLYFVAHYIRNHMDDSEEISLLETIDHMIDTVSSSQHSTIIMFLIYFANDRLHIINRLVENASRVYQEMPQAKLEDDTRRFTLTEHLRSSPKVEEDPDIENNRVKDRERRDEDGDREDAKPQSLHREEFSYASNLSDLRKLHLAEKNIEVLGQVVRNFTTTLPGPLKIKVIKTTYELGLRAMARVLQLVGDEMDRGAEIIRGLESDSLRGGSPKTQSEAIADLKNFLLMISKVISIHFCKLLSRSVGVADMELAYKATLDSMDATTAVKLVDMTIRMEHSTRFPEAEITEIYLSLKGNQFAQAICGWLIAGHLLMYKVERPTRQRMAKLLNFDPAKLEAAISRTAEARI